jgi:hypothetical protein
MGLRELRETDFLREGTFHLSSRFPGFQELRHGHARAW